MANKKRYVVCGVSGRAIGMYIGPMMRVYMKVIKEV